MNNVALNISISVFCGYKFSIFLNRYLKVELLGHTVILFWLLLSFNKRSV